MVFQVVVDVVELGLDEHHVPCDIGKVGRVHANSIQERGAGFPGFAGAQRNGPVLENARIDQ